VGYSPHEQVGSGVDSDFLIDLEHVVFLWGRKRKGGVAALVLK